MFKGKIFENLYIFKLQLYTIGSINVSIVQIG